MCNRAQDVAAYEAFIAAKQIATPDRGRELALPVSEGLFPFQADAVTWAVHLGCAALFESFGLGKTRQELEYARQVLALEGGRFLIVAPLGVRGEFMREADALGLELTFIQRTESAGETGIYLTNYESVREGNVDPLTFVGVALDEASILRGFGGTKTFREFMGKFEGSGVRYRLVATATPSPNDYEELLAYAAFLDVAEIADMKTRFFKRDSTKADCLTVYPHKEEEFFRWVSTWALFLTRPSDADPTYSDEGYALPPMEVAWHELPSDHATAGVERSGQVRLLADASVGIVEASREKRRSLDARVARVLEIVTALRTETPAPGATGHAASGLSDQVVIWCDLNDEQRAIEKALGAAGITVSSMYGADTLDDREANIERWRSRETSVFLSKPVMYGAGVNLQQCHTMVFAGVGYKFQDAFQGMHRVQRFGQTHPVSIHMIYTESERSIREAFAAKWTNHVELVERMAAMVRSRGLARAALTCARSPVAPVARVEARTSSAVLVNNDNVRELARCADNSIGLYVTSYPYGNQYRYTELMEDFGHTDSPEHFFAQMDFLMPHVFRTLQPGRVLAVHVKDRITPGGLSGMGFRTLYPFHADCIANGIKHGFGLIGMITVITDVVRENNQTNRLGYSAMCKDSSSMGVGVPEHVLIFRKPQTDKSKGFADVRVTREKASYPLARWQIVANGLWGSSGERVLTADDLAGVDHSTMYKLWKASCLSKRYDFEEHVALNVALQDRGALPVDFSLFPVHSKHPDVWTDVTRMRTSNSVLSAKGRELHVCLAVGSLVLTRGEGYKPIETVQPGDEVLTHRGRWRRVLVSQSTGVRPVVTVRAQGVPGLTLTPDHKLWTRRAEGARKRDSAERAEPSWIEAQHTVGSYVNLKLPPIQEPAVGDLTHWWVVGRWLADGSMTARGGASIACGRHKLAALQEMLGHFGGNPAHDTGTCFQILLRDKDQSLRATLARCGEYAHGKHLPPEAFTLPGEHAAALLDGYLSGDGHYLPERGRWQATSASKPLLLGLALLAQRVHGTIPSVHPGRNERDCVIEGREVHAHQEWVMSFDVTTGERRKAPFILDDGAWKKVRDCEPSGETETWNLRVEEDESYTAEGCVVKNCPMQWDIVDRLIEQYSNPGDIVGDFFGGVGTTAMRAVVKGRHGWSCELSERYHREAVAFVTAAERKLSVPTLFDLDAAESAPDKEPEACSNAPSAPPPPPLGPESTSPQAPAAPPPWSADPAVGTPLAPVPTEAAPEPPAPKARKPRAPRGTAKPRAPRLEAISPIRVDDPAPAGPLFGGAED